MCRPRRSSVCALALVASAYSTCVDNKRRRPICRHNTIATCSHVTCVDTSTIKDRHVNWDCCVRIPLWSLVSGRSLHCYRALVNAASNSRNLSLVRLLIVAEAYLSMCVYIDIYWHIAGSVVYILHICMCVCVCVCIDICIYMYTSKSSCGWFV